MWRAFLPGAVLLVLCGISPGIRAQTRALWAGTEWQQYRWAFPGNRWLSDEDAIERRQVFLDPGGLGAEVTSSPATPWKRDRQLAGNFVTEGGRTNTIIMGRDFARLYPGDIEGLAAFTRMAARLTYYEPEGARGLPRENPEVMEWIRQMRRKEPENAYPILLQLAVVYGGYLNALDMKNSGISRQAPALSSSQQVQIRRACLALVHEAAAHRYYDDGVTPWALSTLRTLDQYRPLAPGEKIAVLDYAPMWRQSGLMFRGIGLLVEAEAHATGFPARNRRGVLATSVALLRIKGLIQSGTGTGEGMEAYTVQRLIPHAALRPFMGPAGARRGLTAQAVRAARAMALELGEPKWAQEFAPARSLTAPLSSPYYFNPVVGSVLDRGAIVPPGARVKCWIYEDLIGVLTWAAAGLSAIWLLSGILMWGNGARCVSWRERMGPAGLALVLAAGLGAWCYAYVVVARLGADVFWVAMAASFGVTAALLLVALPWVWSLVRMQRAYGEELGIARAARSQFLGLRGAGKSVLNFPAMLCWLAALLIPGVWAAWGIAFNLGQDSWWPALYAVRAEEWLTWSWGGTFALINAQLLLGLGLLIHVLRWRYWRTAQLPEARQYALRLWRDTLGGITLTLLWLLVFALSGAPFIDRLVTAAIAS